MILGETFIINVFCLLILLFFFLQKLMKELQEQATLSQKRIWFHESKLLCTLCLLGNLESYKDVADRFKIQNSTLHNMITKVCHAITELHEHCIKFPTTEQALLTQTQGFNKFGFPGVVGCLGVSHIEIPGPGDHKDAYVNRNGDTSIQLQAIVGPDLLFTDIYAGWPGSVHKSCVFRNSPIGKFCAAGNLPVEFHLLGSSGYDLTKSCMVPYQTRGELTATQGNYNKVHNSAYLCVKRAFNLLKEKFCRLRSLEMQRNDAIPIVIAAACVLHNFILNAEGSDDANKDDEESDGIDCEIVNDVEWEESARLKRDNIASSL